MTHQRFRVALFGFLLGHAGCQSRQDPVLCICGSIGCTSELAKSFEELDCASPSPTKESEDPLWVMARLPPEVTITEPLRLRLSTPCKSVDFNEYFRDGVALLSTRALPGSSCSLEVTAEVSNSTTRVRSQGMSPDASCAAAKLSAECASSADAGGAGGQGP